LRDLDKEYFAMVLPSNRGHPLTFLAKWILLSRYCGCKSLYSVFNDKPLHRDCC
jgi:hypothetical protein